MACECTISSYFLHCQWSHWILNGTFQLAAKFNNEQSDNFLQWSIWSHTLRGIKFLKSKWSPKTKYHRNIKFLINTPPCSNLNIEFTSQLQYHFNPYLSTFQSLKILAENSCILLWFNNKLLPLTQDRTEHKWEIEAKPTENKFMLIPRVQMEQNINEEKMQHQHKTT